MATCTKLQQRKKEKGYEESEIIATILTLDLKEDKL